MNLFNSDSGLYCVQVRYISNKIWTQITPVVICSACLCVKVLEKIIARMLCFIDQDNFRPNYIFITMLIF